MKVAVQDYKRSLHECGAFDAETIDVIWDFYVTHSVASASGLKRTAKDYGWRELPYRSLLATAHIAPENFEMLMADSISGVLKEHDLVIEEKAPDTGNDIGANDGKGSSGARRQAKAIDVDTLRGVCVQPYTITDRKRPEGKLSKPECLLTHVRNAFAHGNTYWFDNGNVLLADRAGGSSGKTTAMLLIESQTLVEWVKLVDAHARYYFSESSRGTYEAIDKEQEKKRNSRKKKKAEV